MNRTRKPLISCLLAGLLCSVLSAPAAHAQQAGKIERFVRYQAAGKTSYGLLEGKQVRRIEGDLFGSWKATNDTLALDDVELLVPTTPTQVLAMAGNYKSHIDAQGTVTVVTTVTTITTDGKTKETKSTSNTTVETRGANEIPERFRVLQPFFKSPSSLAPQDAEIVLPKDAGVVHYEAELVIVIGKTARNVSREDALDCVFGVTCGNDVSERGWQKGDIQWWRAKASDTFGPCGPCIVRGLNYDKLAIELRVNGEVKQQDNTSEMIHDIAAQVSTISQYITLQPGDLIFTGTPGLTDSLHDGDVVEVEIEGVGVLRNKVKAEK